MDTEQIRQTKLRKILLKYALATIDGYTTEDTTTYRTV